MENQDKIYEQFKHAADKAENKGFDRMEAVWNRVEDKLDNRKKRRAIYWKYTGVAAMLLVFIGLGSQFFKNTTESTITPQATPEIQVVTIDTNRVKEVVAPKGVDALKNSKTVVATGNTGDDNKTGEIPMPVEKLTKTNDSVYFTNGALFTTSQKVDDPEYYFSAKKIQLKPGKAEQTVIARKEAEASAPTGDIIIPQKETVTAFTNNNSRNMANVSGDIIMAKDKYKEQDKALIQPNIITGFVSDETGPLPGASIFIKGTSKSAQTDMDGKFSIEALKGEQLEISFIGYESQDIKVGTSNTIGNITLSADSMTLSEVVVDHYRYTGKREKKAKESTATKPAKGEYSIPENTAFAENRNYRDGDINTTATKEAEIPTPLGLPFAFFPIEENKDNAVDAIEDKANANVIQSLQGQVAGLNIASGSGQPGADSTIILRGVSSINGNAKPLFVIDGIPVDEDAFRSINQKDIVSFNVLKDGAATSIYGNRGANGVVVIVTKNANLTEKQKRKLERVKRKAERQEEKEPKIGVDEEDYESFEENKFENPAKAPLSTFSIDVDNASYTNIRRFINNGQIVPKDAVRVEEMINFFKYSYPQPVGKEPFSINTEYSDAPWNPNHKLLKIGLKGREIPTAQLPASNFVFLIDVSGSMDEPNKLPLLKESMKLLVKQMRNTDRIAIVVYAGAAGLVLPSTSGSEKETIIAALDNLQAGGSTAGGAGIELAYKTAVENFIKDGNNRVVLATDGDFNVGASSNGDMETLIEEKRKSGVFLTCLGYGMGNYKDSKMEILADKGNGNYAYIDNMQEADRFLQKEFKGSMFAIAKDVKIQVEFNPKHVQSYRLIGYENRKLRDEDFANDAIDAGELGSGHTVTALYEIIPTGVHSDFYIPESDLKYTKPAEGTGNYNDELATIKLRHKKPDGDKSTETVQVVPNQTVPLYQASGDFKFAAAVAWFGLKLRDSKLVKDKSSEAIIKLAREGLLNDPEGYRAEFVRLVNRIE